MKVRIFSRNVRLCCSCAGVSSCLQIAAYYANIWGRWKKTSDYCLPLPPPIGCDSIGYGGVDVLHTSSCDFRLLTLLGGLLTSIATMLIYFHWKDNFRWKNLQLKYPALRKTSFYLLILSAILNLISCIIASIRMHMLTSMNRYYGLFKLISIEPSASLSYYLAGFSILVSLWSSSVAINLPESFEPVKKKLPKTIKQHLSRDLMYPNDKHNQKMISFSSMPAEMEEKAAEICVKAAAKFTLEEDIAEYVKKEFEEQFGAIWHCIAGENFGSAVQHKSNEYVEFSLPQISILLFRCEKPRIVV